MPQNKLIAVCCVILFLCMFACGRKGDPVPDNSHDMFSFENVSGKIEVSGVLTIQGNISGAAKNVEYVIVELQPVDGELCLGCPFLAQEKFRYESTAMNLDIDSGNFELVTLPSFKAPAYRWRIVGRNVYPGISDTSSSVNFVE